MFIIYLFLTSILILKQVLVFIQKKIAGTFAITLHFLTSHNHVTSSQKQVTDVSLVLKDSNMESENLSSLIRLSVSDGKKTDRLNIVSFTGI